MTIDQMHDLFRVLGQQMGLQNVRAILPESIDLFLRDAIIKKVRKILSENLTIDAKNKFVANREQITPINALRTLYVETIKSFEAGESGSDKSVTLGSNEFMVILGASVAYSNKRYGCRFVDNIELENTLNDYCNRPSKEYPIATYNNGKVRFYFGNDLSIVTSDSKAYIKMIKTPAEVSSTSNPKVNCDLPEYLHNEMVEEAVSLYFVSLGKTSQK